MRLTLTLLFSVMVPSVCFGTTTRLRINPVTGRPDLITNISSSTLPSGSTQYIQNSASPTTTTQQANLSNLILNQATGSNFLYVTSPAQTVNFTGHWDPLTHDVGFGQNPIFGASSESTICMGGDINGGTTYGAMCNNAGSIAIGYVDGNTATNNVLSSGYFSTAIGGGQETPAPAQATGDFSTAIGPGTLASGYSSSAFGANAIASNINTLSFGGSASGIAAVSVGGSASGTGAISLGPGTSASNVFSMALGNGASSSYANSVAIGHNVTNTTSDEIVVGSAFNPGSTTSFHLQGKTSNDNTNRLMSGVDLTWVDSTGTTRKPKADWQIYDATGTKTYMSVETDGSASSITFRSKIAVKDTTATYPLEFRYGTPLSIFNGGYSIFQQTASGSTFPDQLRILVSTLPYSDAGSPTYQSGITVTSPYGSGDSNPSVISVISGGTTISNQSSNGVTFFKAATFNSSATVVGLTSMNGGSVVAYRAITSTYTVTLNDYIVDCSTNSAFTVTMPDATGVAAGQQFNIFNSSGVVTIATTAGQTINGLSTITLRNKFESIELFSDNANWKVK